MVVFRRCFGVVSGPSSPPRRAVLLWQAWRAARFFPRIDLGLSWLWIWLGDVKGRRSSVCLVLCGRIGVFVSRTTAAWLSCSTNLLLCRRFSGAPPRVVRETAAVCVASELRTWQIRYIAILSFTVAPPRPSAGSLSFVTGEF